MGSEKERNYQTELGKLFEGDPFNPSKETIDKKNILLKKAAQHFYKNSKPYRDLWTERGYSPDELKLPNNLDLFPFFSTEEFKRYRDVVQELFSEEPEEAPDGFENYEIFHKEKKPEGVLIKAGKKNPFPENILQVSKDELDNDYPMVTSSATTGNPSIEYLTPLEKEMVRKAYSVVINRSTNGKKVDRALLFGPSPEDTPTAQSAIGREECKIDKGNGENTYFLLSECNFDLNTIPERAKELTDEAYKNDESVSFSFSTQLFYEFLKKMKKENHNWNFGNKGYVPVGGGGWNGKKGKLITDAVDPKEFVEATEEVLGIPKTNINDIYGVSEPVPFACYSDWSDKKEAFVHHVPRAYCSMQVVDENDPMEVLGKGETGLLKVATPVAIAQPRINTLIYDLVEPTKIENDEVVDFIFKGKADIGEDEVHGCGLRDSIKKGE